METIENVFYTSSKSLSQALDIYLPDCESFPVFIYFHGGGIEYGRKDDEREIVFYENLQKKGVAVISANYRMYPEAAYKFMEGYSHCKYVHETYENGNSTFADMVYEFIIKYN